MLMGLDVKDINLVILYSPFHTLNSFVQAAGRAGRRSTDGKRKKSVVYALYSHTDIRVNVPKFAAEVRDFYKSGNCLKVFVNKFFSNTHCPTQSIGWCCSNCMVK